MTATYEKSGLNFMYPENWSLAEDDMEGTPRTVSVQAPTGAFWSLDIYPFSLDIEQLLDETVATMKDDYSDLEADAAAEEIGGEPAIGPPGWTLDPIAACEAGHRAAADLLAAR